MMPHPGQLDLAAALTTARPQPAIQYVSIPASLDLDRAFESVAARIAAATPPVDVVVVWTPHDRLVEVTYVQQLHQGGAPEFDQHLDRALDQDLAYAPRLQRLRGLDGVASLHCVSWAVAEQNLGQAVSDILARVGGRIRARAATQLARPAASREFPSVRGAEVLQALQPYVETAEERALVNGFVHEQFPARTMAATRHLDDTARTQLQQRYAHDAALLASSTTKGMP